MKKLTKNALCLYTSAIIGIGSMLYSTGTAAYGIYKYEIKKQELSEKEMRWIGRGMTFPLISGFAGIQGAITATRNRKNLLRNIEKN